MVKITSQIYVSFEQRLNNLVRYAGEFPINALKVAMFSRVWEPALSPWQVKSFGVRQSKIIKYSTLGLIKAHCDSMG